MCACLIAVASTAACSQSVDNSSPEEAFKSFWLSTDCAEIQSLTDWDFLKATFNADDDTLCNTFVSMHQQVRDVQILETQKIDEAKVRVKAVIATAGGPMDQEDTLVLKNGGWVLGR